MPSPKEKPVVVTLRIPADQHKKLKAVFWRTAPKHQMPFNTWACEVLEAGLEKKS